ncbi:hypothetical protein CTAYLR_007277 [Chrysophaeum taylorii]|uniref:Amino acid transporter transmembrane domain-containing protein n=1 Tax=Chrysophaeum taylorii TaxID=2483200 RepID=A0AAD7XN25_9STRA|nr:hypothetical protein CTAYLR_007277 [Chrysophaeum taylorii]
MEEEGQILLAGEKPPPNKVVEEGTSTWSAGFALAKTIDGAGCFAMPWAARTGGWAGFCVCLFACVVLGAFSLGHLFDLKRRKGAESYAELARLTIFDSAAAGAVVRVLVAVCTTGVASAYVAFIASMMGMTRRWHAVLAAGLLALPTTCLPSIRRIADAARVGVAAVGLGSLVVVASGLSTPNGPPLSPFTTFSGFNQCFGTVAFLFCVHFTVFPVEHAMDEPIEFARVGRVVFGLTGLLNLVFGLVSAALYPDVSPVVVNDVEIPILRLLTQLCLCIDLLASYPIIFVAAVHNIAAVPTDTDDHHKHGDRAFSTTRVAVFLTTVIVALSESFAAIVAFVGGFGQALLALVVPPLMVAISRRPLSPSAAILQAATFALGAALVVSSTTTAVATLIADHHLITSE